MSVGNKISDHRLLLALVWTFGSFGFLFTALGLMYLGVQITIEHITTVLAALLPLDAIFLENYFRSKEREVMIRNE